MKGLFVLRTDAYHNIYGPERVRQIEECVHIYALPQTAEALKGHPEILAEADIIFSGWGMPVMDEALLAAAPNLKIVFYGAGSIKQIVTEAFWQRNIPIVSAYAGNAIPTAEFALTQIIYSLKRGWHYSRWIDREGCYPEVIDVPGAYDTTVGLVSLGMVGRHVRRLLQAFDVRVIAYDPYLTDEDAARFKVERCSLEDLFRRADVVSLHTPWLKETENMITGAHLASMKPNSTLVNTSRGAIIREHEMIDVLRQRPDLFAVLDVTHPEPPESGSLLYTLPNVVLTPHLAGSRELECRRMGKIIVEELQRWLNNEPLQWAISQEQVAIMA